MHAFLRHPFGDAVSGDWWLLVFTAPAVHRRLLASGDEAVAYARTQAAGENVCFWPGLIRGRSAFGALWADIDLAGQATGRRRSPVTAMGPRFRIEERAGNGF